MRCAGYDRALFPHWKDLNGDCQNTRHEVLIAETSVSPTYTSSSRCSVASGRWFSYYDRVTWTAASDVDIDHVVALAEAWDSGARNWTTARRQSFANDLGDSRSLVAVTDNVNRRRAGATSRARATRTRLPGCPPTTGAATSSSGPRSRSAGA